MRTSTWNAFLLNIDSGRAAPRRYAFFSYADAVPLLLAVRTMIEHPYHVGAPVFDARSDSGRAAPRRHRCSIRPARLRGGADIGKTGISADHPASADEQRLATDLLHDPGTRRSRRVQDSQNPVSAMDQVA
jgi:hypothetical protein